MDLSRIGGAFFENVKKSAFLDLDCEFRDAYLRLYNKPYWN